MSEQIEREESLQEAAEQTADQLEAKAANLDAGEPAAGEVVDIDESGAEVVQAEVVNVQSGAIGKATAETIEIKEGAIGIAQGGTITVHEGAIGAAFAERAEVHNGAVLLMLAEEVGGETKVLFDLRAAVVFGVIVGVVSGLIRLFAGRKGK